MPNSGKGIAAGLIAYILWGFLPLYWKALGGISSLEILGHRICWSGVLLLPLALVGTNVTNLRHTWLRAETLRIFIPSSLLLGANWFTYIYAVNTGRILETSLGYFLTPLFSILLARLILGETLRRAQWVSVALAASGVAWMMLQAEHFPGLALFLAVTFALYGLLQKLAPLGSISGLTLETLLLAPVALAYLMFRASTGNGAFGTVSWGQHLLLVGSGVATSLPLLFFGASARRISLTTLGFMLYISPTLQFIIGWRVFHEPLSIHRLIGFICIWLALSVFSLDSIWHSAGAPCHPEKEESPRE